MKSSVSTIEGAPRLLKCDLGTENANLAFMQPFLRQHGTDCFAEFDSFRYGKSPIVTMQESKSSFCFFTVYSQSAKLEHVCMQ